MLHGEAATTGTSCESMKRQSTISECKSIPKGPFVQGETKLIDWKGGRPTGGTFLLGTHSPLKG